MKKITSLVAMVAAIGSGTMAFAGGPGPVVIEDAPVVITEEDAGTFGSLGGNGAAVAAGVVGLALLVALASGDDDDDSSATDTIVDAAN